MSAHHGDPRSLARNSFVRIMMSCACLVVEATAVHGAPPVGELQGSGFVHDEASLRGAIDRASVGLPATVTGASIYVGRFDKAPATTGTPVPVVVFLHGSSGLSLKAIAEWQTWLAGLGIASFAPDSFALPDRVTYKSPIDKSTYERIHALRASESAPSVAALRSARWADPGRLALAGASEGGPAVARYDGDAFLGRILYSWSCEDNYFVVAHRTAAHPTQPVLNVMSSTDVFFSPSNPWLGNPDAKGHCADTFKDNTKAAVVLIPGAPHTLLNVGAARHATKGFLVDLFGL